MDYTLKIETPNIPAIDKQLTDAVALALRDIIIDTAHDAIVLSPHVTGHNRRSLAYKVGDKGAGQRLEPAKADEQFEAEYEGETDKFTGAIYSTSGYGGYLETGTSKMSAQPYMKPAADKNLTDSKFAMLVRSHIEE